MRLCFISVLCTICITVFAAETFQDCDLCPQMTIIPGGTYMKGSPQNEPGRANDDRNHDEDSQAGPGGTQVKVSVPAFALGTHEVTNREFGRFVDKTGYEMRVGCIAYARRDGSWSRFPNATWNNTARPFNEDFPATCIDWHAANAYIKWLSDLSGQPFRLPTESEFEHARRAGSASAYHFGSDPVQSCRYGNVPDADYGSAAPGRPALKCSDGYWDLAAVGQFEPNAFGIYDITGNIWEWLSDCYEKSYANAPTDGSALLSGDCEARSIRGGSWGYDLSSLRSADRSDDPPDALYDGIGFRIARDL